MTPQTMGLWALECFALGAAAAAAGDFLYPVQGRFRVLTDGVMSLWLVWIWLQISFGVCGGNIRLGFWLCAGLGAAAWTGTVSPRLRRLNGRLFALAEGRIRKIMGKMKIVWKKIKKYAKKHFPFRGKKVIIGKTKCKNG